MRFSGVVVLIFLVIYSSVSQEFESDSICWAENRKLNWSDFHGQPDTNTSFGLAGCAAELQAVGYWDNGLPNFLVTNYFMKNSSWTVDTVSSHLLQHEQLHFDIAELHARLIRQVVDSLRNEKVAGFVPYSKKIQYLLERRNKIDSLYDKETAHSIYETRQKEWNKKIWDELKCLQEYASECD